MPPPNKKQKSSVRDGSARWRPTLSDINSKKENDRYLPSWSNLPAVLLREIYKTLADVDRASMARVCKTWCEAFHDPCLWITKTIMFCHRKDEKDLKAKNEFYYTSGLQLKTLRGQMRTHLVNALDRFIEKREFLKIFFMHKTYFDPESGLQFLKSLATSSGATIEILSLKGFCLEENLIYRERRFVTEMQKFTNLFYIQIDYVMLSGELMQFWSKACPLISYVDISSEGFLPQNHEIRCETWQDLTNAHPKLSVSFEAQKIRSTREMLPILSPAIPVSKLKLQAWGDGVTSEFELTSLLHRVARYHRTIKKLFLEIPGDFPSFDTISVQNILSNCRHLLPFTCEESVHLLTGRNVWRLRLVNQSLVEEFI